MTNEQILKKAIEMAIKNGYNLGQDFKKIYIDNGYLYHKTEHMTEFISEFEDRLYASGEEIIFSHEFAKAFWGEGPADEQYNLIDKYWQEDDDSSLSGFYFQGDRWQYHLQQMVLEEEPIKYLEQFIK